MMYLPDEKTKEMVCAEENVKKFVGSMEGYDIYTKIEAINTALNERFDKLSTLNEEVLVKEKEIEKVSYEIKLLAEEGLWLTDNNSEMEV